MYQSRYHSTEATDSGACANARVAHANAENVPAQNRKRSRRLQDENGHDGRARLTIDLTGLSLDRWWGERTVIACRHHPDECEQQRSPAPEPRLEVFLADVTEDAVASSAAAGTGASRVAHTAAAW